MSFRSASMLCALFWASACGGGASGPVELPSPPSTADRGGGVLRLARAESPCEEPKPLKGYGAGAHFRDGTFVWLPSYLGHHLIPEAGLLFRECAAGCALFAPQRATDLGSPRSCDLSLPEPSWPGSDPMLASISSPWRGTIDRILGRWPENALVVRDLGNGGGAQEVLHVQAARARLVGDASGGAVLEGCRYGDSRNADGKGPAADRSQGNSGETTRSARALGDLIGAGEWLDGGTLALWLRVSCEPQLELLGAATGTTSPRLPPAPAGALPVAFESNRLGWAVLVWATRSGSITALWLWAPGQRLPVVEHPEGKLLGGELHARHPPLIALDPSGGVSLVIESRSSAQRPEPQLWHRGPTGWRVSKRWPAAQRSGCAPEVLSVGADGAVWVGEGPCHEPRLWRGHTRVDSQWRSVRSPTRFKSESVTQIMPLPSGEAFVVVERNSDGPLGLHRDLWSVREGNLAAAGAKGTR